MNITIGTVTMLCVYRQPKLF